MKPLMAAKMLNQLQNESGKYTLGNEWDEMKDDEKEARENNARTMIPLIAQDAVKQAVEKERARCAWIARHKIPNPKLSESIALEIEKG